MQELVTRLTAGLAALKPELAGALNLGAPAWALRHLQHVVGVELPADMLAFYELVDGQDPDAVWIAYGAELMSIERIFEEWEEWTCSGYVKQFEGDCQPAPGIRGDAWWQQAWIPLTTNGLGDYYCLDMAPAPGGRPGKVITVSWRQPVREIVAPSFTAWLQRLCVVLEEHSVYSEEDEAVFRTDH